MLQRTEALACTHSETHHALEPVYDMSQIGGTFLLHAASEQVHRGSTTGGEEEKSKCNTEDCGCDDEGSTIISSAIIQLSATVRAVSGITWTTT